MFIKPKSKEIEKIFDRLVKHTATSVSTRTAIDLARNKKIRYLRSIDNIFIGNDRIKNKSIIYIPPNVKLKKKDDKFLFFY